MVLPSTTPQLHILVDLASPEGCAGTLMTFNLTARALRFPGVSLEVQVLVNPETEPLEVRERSS